MNRRTLISLLLSCIAVSLAGSAWASVGGTVDFRLVDINQRQFNLADHLGKKVILVDFWATWCKPCKRELPVLQELYDKYKERGFLVVAISVDKASDQGNVKPYVSSKGYTFPVLFDNAGNTNERYNATKSMPYSLLIGLDGKIAAEFSGYNPGDEKVLERELLKLLPKQEAPAEQPAAAPAPAQAPAKPEGQS